MAAAVLTNAFVSIGGNDLSSYTKSVTLNYSAATQDATVMGDDTTINIGGLKEWSIDVEFNQDFAVGLLDAILFPLVGTSVACILRPDAGAISTSNPAFNGTGILSTYPPLGGSVGDLEGASISIVSAGTLTRTTA